MSQANNDAKHWNRINGWSFPLHFLQLVAWLFILTFALLYFGVLVPNLPTSWQISASVINCLVFLIHVIVHLISVTLNPADPNVRAKNYRGPLPHFDRNQHAHVIENQFCYICEVKVGIQSKHCSACNKCVSGFDHHCKWLNNCIGNRNYRLFVACVSTALVGCLLVLITSCCLVAAFFTPNSWIYSLDKNISGIETSTHSPLTTENFNTNETSETATESVEYFSNNKTATEKVFYVFVPVNRILWIVVVIITLVLSLIATGLLTHLLGFHMYLMCIGNSTYEYIIRKRDEELPSSSSPKSQCCFDWNCGGNNLFKKLLSKKANQISPTSNGKDSSTDNENEFAMKPNAKNNTNSSRKEGVSIPVLDVTTPKDKSSQEKTLENILGNVYLGSPERQRHFLEPIYVNNRKANRTKDMSKRQMETILSGDKTNLSTDESSLQNSCNEKEANSSHGNVSSRKRHPSASPASLLPPIMEMENISSPSLSKWYRSVSAQSLNSLSDTDDLRSYSSLNKDGGAVLPGLALSKRVNSSLSNLLISMEENRENNSDQHDSDDEASGQNYTQSTDTKDSDIYGALVSSSELIVENDEETNDYATQNDSYLSERTEREENDQWADFVSKKKYYSGEDCVSIKPTTRIINEENAADESGKNYPLVSSPRESDFEQFSNERKYNNFFRPVNNSKVIMIGNTKDDGLHEANYFNNQSGNLTNNSEIFDSVVFDTQRSYSNITPVV